MGKRQFELSEQEVKQLVRAEDTVGNVRELRRLQAVRLYGTGYVVEEVQKLTGCSWRSLMEWCQAYRREGIAGLASRWQGQNAAKLSREQRAELREKVNSYRPDQLLAPDVRISQGQFWTVSDLKWVIQQWYGVTYRSQSSYRILLHESRLSVQRTAKQYRSRPDERRIADFEAELEKK
jgi:putative transposase